MDCETADFGSPDVPHELYDIPRVINILILGDADSGKSTWINSFANYISFKSLEDAENGEPCTLIPSEFSIYDTNLNKITVRTHSVRNEAPNIVHVYSYDVGKTTIRLIDPPEVGSPQGVWQDKTNFELTLTTIANLQELHGICILLKADNARFAKMFRLYIKEILTLLHHEAVKNILFCFTNSCGTFYRPGDALSTLQNLLKENQNSLIPIFSNTVYCFDNEAYQYLAAIKNQPPINFPADEREIFVTSWNKSTMETKRMLAYIKNLTPHKIERTLDLISVRNLVLKLVRPMTQMINDIPSIESELENEKKEIERLKNRIEILKGILFENKAVMERIPTQSPSTVCGNSNCIINWDLGDNRQTIQYAQLCHLRCHCTLSVPSDILGPPELINCCAFTNDTCRECGHNYKDHLHIYYDSHVVYKSVENPVVRKMLDEYGAANEMKQKTNDQKYTQLVEHKYEQLAMEKVFVKLAYFVKDNAITLFNDAFQEFKYSLLNEEEERVKRGGSRSVVDSIEQRWDSYRLQELLLPKYPSEQNLPSLADITKLVNDLQKLKHSGQLMTTLFSDYIVPEQRDEQME